MNIYNRTYTMQNNENEENMFGEIIADDEEQIQNYFSSGIELQLGDIIQVISPTNLELNENTYFIYYIDESKIKLVNLSNKQLEQLNINEAYKTFTDESITEIYLLSRSEEQGYAKQNGLITRQWIDIHFGGEVPTIVTGVISNTEEDSIEITTFPENNVFYIDFEYKGIPETIPIEQIIKRDEPRGYVRLGNDIDKLRTFTENKEEIEEDENSPSMEYTDRGEIVINISPDSPPNLEYNIREVLHDMYLDANDLFAESVDVYQVVEIPESERKYGLQLQINDMTDNLLSDIPNYKKTPDVLANIQKLVNRYKELRQMFSVFDQNYNVVDKKKYGNFYKPICDRLYNLDAKLQWIIPVVKQNKKMYYDRHDENEKISDFEEGGDVIPLEITDELADLKQRIDNYSEDLNEVPFEPPNEWKDLITYKRNVLADIETIISNYDDMLSHGCCIGKKHNNISSVKYATQRYTFSNSPTLLSGENHKEKISIKSFMVFPRSIIQSSRVHSLKSNLLLRSNINQVPFYLFRFLKTLSQDQIIEHKINSLEKKRTFRNQVPPPQSFENIYSNNKVHILSLDEDFTAPINTEREPYFYKQFLNTVFPSNEVILEQLEKYIDYRFSFYDFIKELEPFMMYSDNIFYKIYNRISYRIRKQIVEYKKTFSQKTRDYTLWNNAKFNFNNDEDYTVQTNLNNLLKENDAIYEYYKKYVSLDSSLNEEQNTVANEGKNGSRRSSSKTLYFKTPSEILGKIISYDNATLFHKLLSMLLISLMTPDKLMDVFEVPVLEDMSKDEKIQSKDCIRRFLTKIYNSIEELQKDNNTEDVFYDDEYDDTPYSIIDKYKEERRKMIPDKFVEYLKENLLEKHNCPSNMVNEMVETLMNKKKRVRSGEYAILKLVPSLSKRIDFENTTKEERDQIEVEKKIKTKIHYYRRVKDHWVKDNDINENAFLDTNTFFCNINKACHKNQTSKTCDSSKTAVKSIIRKERNDFRELVKQDADVKFSFSIEEIQLNLERQIEYYYKVQRRNKVLRNLSLYYQNNLTFEIGKYANTDEIISSPYANLLYQIRSQENFPKKQHDIVRFYSTYCREPLPEEESQEWLYCIETNIKLLPRSLFLLASEYVKGGDYFAKLNEVCKMYGKLSDDGDSVVDKFSGYELRKIDFVGENFGFQENDDELLKDLGELIAETFLESKPINKKQKMAKIYEDETTQNIYNVMSALCFNMSIEDENLHELIMRLSCELIKTAVMSEKSYNDRLARDEKKATKRPVVKYEMYKNQTMITLVCSVLLVAVQTVIPGIKIRKTFPNCVKIFEGFPLLSGEEDQRGIKYIACVVGKTKSSIVPWNSVEKISVTSMEKAIFNILKSIVLPNNEVQILYQKRRDAPREEVLEDGNIPIEHSIQKWIRFLPPLVKLGNITDNLHGLSKEFHEETVKLMRDGDKDQHLHIQQYHVKNRLNTFGIVELINEKVKTKEMLLRTMAKVPFLENGCCSEKSETDGSITEDHRTAVSTGSKLSSLNIHPLSYFIKEDDHIKLLLLRSMKNVEILHGIEKKTKPLIFYNNENTKWKCPDIPSEYLSNDVYSAFIYYCNLDNDRPIPPELKVVIQEKPAGYNVTWSLEEKMAFLKRHGKNFGISELEQMMRIIREQTSVKTSQNVEVNSTNVIFKEFLQYLEISGSVRSTTPSGEAILVEPLCRNLLEIMDTTDGNASGSLPPQARANESIKIVGEDREEKLRNLRNYLVRTNTQFFNEIIDFLKKFGKSISQSELNQYENYIINIMKWKSREKNINLRNLPERSMEESNKHIDFIKNLIYFMIQDYPNIILNNATFSSIPTHKWGLSSKHVSNIKKIILNEKSELNKFKNKGVLRLFLENIQNWSADVKTFIDLIPLEKGEPFDEESKELIFLNIWYAVLVQFIRSASSPELLEISIQHNRNMRREQRREMEESSSLVATAPVRITGETPNYFEEETDLEVIEVVSGNILELKETVCSLLTTFLSMGQQNKKIIDKKYEDISKMVGITKLQEKKAITDFLQNMEDEERKVEYLLKQNKMGRWNLGTQRGIFEYDKKQYDIEESTNMARLYSEIQGDSTIDNGTSDPNGIVYNSMDAQQYEGSQVREPDEGYTDLDQLGEDYYDNVGGDEEPDDF